MNIMNKKCFFCDEKIKTSIYIGFDKYFCSNICRNKIYIINNKLDPDFNNLLKWIDIINIIDKKDIIDNK